ncbi:hypothetical protein F5Y10DRAFT_89021 [Nemania abortiva]|nr:hypothetical protein F5Y10DRAFT_89021 [Nemania abortiva]
MLSRRLYIHAPRSPAMAKAQGWSTAYIHWQTHRRGQSRYRGAGLTYSNYAPRGPVPYHHNTYGQPPKSRGSRFKDMAIGSALTIVLYLTYELYNFRQTVKEIEEEAKEEAKIMHDIERIYFHYDQLLKETEADHSPERAERIRSLCVERALIIIFASIFKHLKDQFTIEDLGPLPRLPEAHEFHDSEKIKDEDTLVLMLPPPPPSAEELDKRAKERALENGLQPMGGLLVVSINASTQDLGSHHWLSGQNDLSDFTSREIIHRLRFMLDNLCKEGKLKPDRSTFITLILRDTVYTLTYMEGSLSRSAYVAG